MKFLSKILITGSILLLVLGIWGRIHIIISGSMILKVIGVTGLIAGLALFSKKDNSKNNKRRY